MHCRFILLFHCCDMISTIHTRCRRRRQRLFVSFRRFVNWKRRANRTEPLSCNYLVAFLFYIRSSIQIVLYSFIQPLFFLLFAFFGAMLLLKSFEAIINMCIALIFTVKCFIESVTHVCFVWTSPFFFALCTLLLVSSACLSHFCFLSLSALNMRRFVLYCFHLLHYCLLILLNDFSRVYFFSATFHHQFRFCFFFGVRLCLYTDVLKYVNQRRYTIGSLFAQPNREKSENNTRNKKIKQKKRKKH